MKTKLLFSTLFATALFTACTSEELLNGVAGEEAEVVGAELLSKGLSFELGTSAETRIADGKWQEGDKVGLGWFVNDNYGAAQTYTQYGQALLSPMAINHRFFFDGEKFQSSSNIYKGWHMAYSPYAYTEQANKDLIIPMNAVPQAVADFKDDQLANRPAISAKDFLDATKINKETGMITTKYDLYYIANQWSPRLAVDAFFSGQEYLKNLKVKYVTVRTTEGTPFQDAVKIDPKQAPSFKYAKWNKDANNKKGAWEETPDFTKAAPYNDDMTKGQFVNAIFGAEKAIQPNGTAVAEVTRNIASTTGFKLDTDQNRINMFFNPVTIANWQTLQIEVGVDQGKFVLAYVEENKDKEPYKSMSDADKAAQKKVNNALKYFAESMKNGVIAIEDKKEVPAKATGAYGAADGALTLTKKDFDADFDNIKTVDDWNKAVALYDALGIDTKADEGEIFTLTGDVTFTDEIKMPANGDQIFVTSNNGKKIIIKGSVDFPAQLTPWYSVGLEISGTLNLASSETFAQVKVNKGATLNLSGYLKVTESVWKKVENLGTINVSKGATLDATYLINSGTVDKKPVNGVIDVVYGSYVKTSTKPIDGIIQFTLSEGTMAYQINNLISEDNALTARVNTLVIPAGVKLDLNKKDVFASTDPYTGVESKETLKSLTNVDIIMDGGEVIGKVGQNAEVKNVIARTATNKIDQVVAQNVTIEKDAVLSIKNDAVKDGTAQDVVTETVKNNGTLTFWSEHNYEEKDKKVVNVGYASHNVGVITNNGVLSVSKVRLNANDITNNDGGTLSAKKVAKDNDSQIRCQTLTNNGTITGDVKANN